MTIDEAANSIKALLYERAKTPFFAAFLFAWIAWNWDFIYYLFATDDSAVDTIENAKEVYITLTKGIVHPLWTSLAVTIAGGLLNLLYYRIRLLMKAIRIGRIDKSDTITTAQRDRIITDHAQARRILSEQIVGLEDEIAALRKENEEVKRQNNNLLNEMAQYSNQATREAPEQGAKNETKDELEEPAELVPPDAKYSLDRPVDANNGTFETLDASILSEAVGSVMVWFVVTREHLERTDDSYMYILAHASSKGARVVRGGTNVYLNMWAIRRVTGKSPQWSFIISNANGTSNVARFVDRRILNPGWHSIGVTWSKQHNRITFYVDGVRKEGDNFKYWPDHIESNFTVGTWPSQTRREFDFRSLVGPVRCYDVELDSSQIEMQHRIELLNQPAPTNLIG